MCTYVHSLITDFNKVFFHVFWDGLIQLFDIIIEAIVSFCGMVYEWAVVVFLLLFFSMFDSEILTNADREYRIGLSLVLIFVGDFTVFDFAVTMSLFLFVF